MPTPKEILEKTVAATAALFQENEQLQRIAEDIVRQERIEESLAAASTTGETEPEG